MVDQQQPQKQLQDSGAKESGLRDIYTALNSVTQAINALNQQTINSEAQFHSILTLTVPTTVSTATYSMTATDTSIIAAGISALTLTLLSASSVPGRMLFVKNTVAFAVNSAASNIVPITGGAATSGIVGATAGKWCILQSDGTNWQIMAAN